jgi:hypothetical protein
LGSVALSPRAAYVPVGLHSAHLGGAGDAEWVHLSGKQFYVLTRATVRTHRLPMDDAAQFWGTGVHVLASDHGSKAKAISKSSLFGSGWLGALVASDKSGSRPQVKPGPRVAHISLPLLVRNSALHHNQR